MRKRTLSILETVVAAVSAARLNRLPLRQRPLQQTAFTLIELLVVMTIILILVGVILAAAGYVEKKGASSRAETEIAAISAALESYKADNGIYPRSSDTDVFNAQDGATAADPTSSPAPNSYQKASQFLYGQLSGDYDNNNPAASTNYNTKIDGSEASRAYFSFKPQMLYTTTTPGNGNTTITTVTFIRDPFGYSYGYSTIMASGQAGGYNPTFDLWSTAGGTGTPNGETFPQYQQQWIKNW